jgi:hypothetical protein
MVRKMLGAACTPWTGRDLMSLNAITYLGGTERKSTVMKNIMSCHIGVVTHATRLTLQVDPIDMCRSQSLPNTLSQNLQPRPLRLPMVMILLRILTIRKRGRFRLQEIPV